MDLELQNRRLYLDLLERCLTNTIYEDPAQGPLKPVSSSPTNAPRARTGRPPRTP
jgi:hypothetical protein